MAVIVLLTVFLITELGMALWSHSLSLLADTGHLLTDIGALGLTLFAGWVAQRPAADQATFGHRRAGILAALANGVGLVAIAALIGWEAIGRLQSPEAILSLPMLLGAGMGLAINSVNLSLLHSHSHADLNLRGAFLHIVADVASSVGVLLAALLIYGLHWLWADALAGLMVAGLTGLSAVPLIQSSLAILMEYAPRSHPPATIAAAFMAFPAVREVKTLRIWAIDVDQVVLCAHLVVAPCSAQERDTLIQQIQTRLSQRHGIHETTLQLTSEPSRLARLHPLLNHNLVAMFAERQEATERGAAS